MKDLKDSIIAETVLHEVSNNWGSIESHAVLGHADMPENRQFAHAPPVMHETRAEALDKEEPSAPLSNLRELQYASLIVQICWKLFS